MDQPSKRRNGIWRPMLAGVLLFGLVMLVAWFGRGQELAEISGEAQGTSYQIKLKVDRSLFGYTDVRLLRTTISDILALVDAQMSTYRADSEIARLNNLPADQPMVLSNGLAHVIGRSLELSRLTDGAFDMTVGPVVDAYGFGPATEPATMPDDELLTQLREGIGYQQLTFDPLTRTIRKAHPQVRCDLNAIAPGYTVDRICDLLDDMKYADYMVELGGEVRVKGLNLEGEPWNISIEWPVLHGHGNQRVLPLKDKAISTSGDHREYVMVDGQRLAHTIDPRSGRPVTHGPASVAVIHDECEWADGWATALMVLPLDEGYNLAEQHNLAVLFMVRGADNIVASRETSAFKAMFPVNSEGRP